MATFSYTPDAVLVQRVSYNTLRTNESYGKERRRNKWASPRRAWNLNFTNASGTAVTDIINFYTTVSGSFDSFSWTNPVDSTAYTVRFQEGSLKREFIGYDRYNVSCSFLEVL